VHRGDPETGGGGGGHRARVAVPEKKDTDALKEIIPAVSVPIVADVHFHFQRALEAVEAGVHKIRLNPGNISDRAQVIDVIQACKARGLPIRVGVNEGSIIERKDKQKRQKELGAIFGEHKHGYLLAIMIAKLEEYLDIFYEQDFYDISISAKSMDAALVIDAYSEISKRFDHPLHLGVTHAGPKETGCIRSIAALSGLLTRGIGDTIRISYANDPIYEVEDGLELLWSLSLRERVGVDLIACPTCGRIQVDLFTLVQDVRKQLAAHVTVPMKVAVMGCIVNGPGEAEGADVAVFAGDRRGIIYVQGRRSRTCRSRRSSSGCSRSAWRFRGGCCGARRSWVRRRWTSCRRTRSGSWGAGGKRSRGRRWPGASPERRRG
jgi:(E)-4-hydroxy-3-methylbut-2-enyl-diphosphate synthase